MGKHGLFALFEHTLGDADIAVRNASLSILFNSLEYDPSLVRSFCLAQFKQNQLPLIAFMIEQFLKETDVGLKSQNSECIRMLLDTTGLDTTEVRLFGALKDTVRLTAIV